MAHAVLSRVLWCLLATCCFWPAAATGALTDPDSWYARSWQTDEGLPNNTIAGLAQTPDGYLWLGTPSGLARFDGIRFEDFSPTNFIAPPNRGTIAMQPGRDGGLWLALDRGAVVHLRAGVARAFTSDLPDVNLPNGLAEDALGVVWVAYRGGSVYRIQNGQVTACAAAQGLPEGQDICALTTDIDGTVWFAKAGAVGTIRNGSFNTLHRVDRAAARLAPAREGGVWLCAGFRLFKISRTGRLESLGEFSSAQGGTLPTALLEDHDGAVWIGTSFSGLFRRDDAGFKAIQTTHQEILCLTEDREGNIWAGTGGGGLNRIRRRTVVLQDTEHGLPFASIQSLCEDSNGNIWAATQNGALVVRTADRWAPLPPTNGWSGGATCVTADSKGNVWIGTRGSGLFCWRDGRFVNWGDRTQLRGLTLHTLVVSKTGELWIGEENPHAIQRLRNGQLRTWEVSRDSRVIRAMTEDTAGNIWAATAKGVLFRITGEELTEVNPRPMGELASIRCLSATPDGALWIGYAGWGIGRFKNGRYAEIHTEHGLFDDYISHIVADGHGWLWLAANRGIFKVRLDDLEAVAETRSPRLRSIRYGRGEGLPSLQGTFGDSPGVLRSRDGRLWIPMRTALAVVEPDQPAMQPEPLPPLLHRIAVDERTIASYNGIMPLADPRHIDLGSPSARLRLSPTHRRLELQFTSLSFTAPENIQFRYRLEGYDEEWVDAGTRRTAPYPRLSAGDYTFHLVASDSEGVWNQAGPALAIVVNPFLWQTWWFRLLVIGLFTLGVITVVRFVLLRRVHQRLALLEQQASLHRERARIAKDIHDDLGASLTQIALLGELARQDREQPDKAGERISNISHTARAAIRSLDEIVWAVNPRNDTLAHLIDYAGQFAVDYLRLAGIRCRLDFPEQVPAGELTTDLRHNLFLVIKEALNNVVKHARASEVWLRARIADGRLEFAVEDNGCGFAAPPEDALADGLRNMRQRMEDIGGRCTIKSTPRAGTTVALELPWQRPNEPGR